MKKVVVTGGAGFIGSNLVEALVKRGYAVTVIDNFSTGKLESVSNLDYSFHKSGSKPISHNPGIIRGNILNVSLLKEAFKGSEYVFHVAAVPSVIKSIASPLYVQKINVTGTLQVLKAALEAGVGKVIYSSSCAVYGDARELPIKEATIPNPLSPYAVSKLVGEYYCQLFTKEYGLPTLILRYFNVYGPRQKSNTAYAAVIPRFIRQILRNKPLIIFGDGRQTRDFVFVSDVVNANINGAQSDITGVFNIGSGKAVSINDLATVIQSITRTTAKTIYKKPLRGEVKHSVADITRARSFNYNPAYTLETGLERTFKFFSSSPAI